jgi:hypothetical protein
MHPIILLIPISVAAIASIIAVVQRLEIDSLKRKQHAILKANDELTFTANVAKFGNSELKKLLEASNLSIKSLEFECKESRQDYKDLVAMPRRERDALIKELRAKN